MTQHWQFLILCLFAFLLASHRLAAPIVEESTPRPTVTPRPKIKPKPPPRPTVKPTPPFSFAGTWSGSFRNACQDMNFTGQVTITVSADQGTVTTEMSIAKSVRPCNRVGDFLQWQDSGVPVSLQKNANGTVTYLSRWAVDGAPCSASGVLLRR